MNPAPRPAAHQAPCPRRLHRLTAPLLLALVLLLAPVTGCGGGPTEAPEDAAQADSAAKTTGSLAPQIPPLLQSPGEEVNLADGFTFRWTAPEGVVDARWRVVVLESPHQTLWRSEETTDTEMQASPALLLRLEPGRSYTWRVLGRLKGLGRMPAAEGRFTAR